MLKHQNLFAGACASGYSNSANTYWDPQKLIKKCMTEKWFAGIDILCRYESPEMVYLSAMYGGSLEMYQHVRDLELSKLLS